ncbi:MAG TPA: S53 family peptidase [Verrucomicrobiae bacterium]|nr:S53 family peptidase [Verrucomicrobiae bacterium]
MRSEGLKWVGRCLLWLAAATIFSAPVRAQHVISMLPPYDAENPYPISFLRPFYVIHSVNGDTASAPPLSAFAPAQIRHAYGFDAVPNQGAGQVIGIVDAYDDPNIESDLLAFDEQFNLPACTTSNGCFRKVYARGVRPAANSNWGMEMSLDVEWAHAIAPQAKIVLVEGASNSLSDLLYAVEIAVNNGASVVSMSWTTGEFAGETQQDTHFAVTGVTFLAASGDSGTGVAYPAASPDVVGVGGTTLVLDSQGNYSNETAWSGSGGGLSAREREPLFQAAFGIPDDARGYRGAPDVSYNANPSTGYAVYDTLAINGQVGWFQVGGTSAAVPQWAALVAMANSLRVSQRKARLTATDTPLYQLGKSNANFHGVTQGSNGKCGAICTAGAGYDYVTGLGTPQAPGLIAALVARP